MAAGTIGIGGLMLLVLILMWIVGRWPKLACGWALATGVMVGGGTTGVVVHSIVDNGGPPVTTQINKFSGDSSGNSSQQPTNSNPGNGRQ